MKYTANAIFPLILAELALAAEKVVVRKVQRHLVDVVMKGAANVVANAGAVTGTRAAVTAEVDLARAVAVTNAAAAADQAVKIVRVAEVRAAVTIVRADKAAVIVPVDKAAVTGRADQRDNNRLEM